MERRKLLRRASTLAVAALAGCISDPPRGPPGGGTDVDSPTPTGSPTSGSAVTDRSFEVVSVTSGGGENSAAVSFGDGVSVDGTIGGNNGCYTARLASTEYDEGTLTVVVEAYEDRAEDEACTDALVDVDYEASFSFEGSLPERVVVEHDSMGERRTVAEETR